MEWTYSDALFLALDDAQINPEVDIEKLANDIWREMQTENKKGA